LTRFLADWMWGQESDLKQLEDGYQSETRKIILSKIGRTPMTVTQLADALNLSRTAIFDHVKDMERRGLIKEVEPSEKQYRTEKYYGLNVPFCTLEDLQTIDEPLKKMQKELSEFVPQINRIFKRYEKEIIAAFDRTSMKAKGYTADDIWVIFDHELSNVVRDMFTKPFSVPGETWGRKPWGFVLVELDDSLPWYGANKSSF
jgi:DNA-binding Lrp family transcriptional regulator